MKHTIVTAAILIVMVTLAFGCSGTPTSISTGDGIARAAPTATRVPPTDMPIPPTDTPVPPTDTPTATATATRTETPTVTATSSPTVTNTPAKTATRTPTRKPPTATPAPLTLKGALARSANSNHRFEMTETFSNPFRTIEVLNAHGEVAGQAIHMYIGGMLGEALKPGGLEVILTRDVYYYLGPFANSKANQPRWYVYVPSQGGDGAPPGNADRLLSPGAARYDNVGSETVDGLACDIYSIDKEAARWAMAASGAMSAQELDNMVNIEFTYWWCADGYVHRARSRVDFKYPPDPSTTMIARLESHYYDFNAPIQINIPTDAVLFPQ